MSPTTAVLPTRDFAVVHIAGAVTQQPIKSEFPVASPLTRPSGWAFVQHPALIVLCVLLYLASVLWFVVTSGVQHESERSTPYIWIVCIPYTTLMIHKLLTTIRAMEATEEPLDQQLPGLEEPSDDCDGVEFGDDASHDAIAVVGDVCIYVIGILLVCYFVLPWQLYVE